MALVELIQHNGIHALEAGIRKQPPRQDALGDKSQSCARSNSFLKPNLIADSLTDLFTEFPCDSPRRQSCRYPTRFEDHYVTSDNAEERGRHAGRLTGPRWRFDYEVRITLQRRDDLRQKHVHGKRGFAAHQFHRTR
jgi:hypothetical protein